MRDTYMLRHAILETCETSVTSRSTAIGTVFGFVIGLILLLSALTERSLESASWADYWASDPVDDYAFISVNAKRASGPRGSCIVLVGTAAMREGLLAPADLAARLSGGHKSPVCVINLMAGGQSPLEATALVHEAAGVAGDIVVLGVSPSRMSANVDELQSLVSHPRLAFSNPELEREIEALGLESRGTTGIYQVDFLGFYGPRVVAFLKNSLLSRAQKNNVHTYDNRPPQSPKAWQADMVRLSTRMDNYDEGIASNLASYRRLIETLLKDHPFTRVVLLDIPINPEALEQAIGHSLYTRHVSAMRSFCQETECLYVNPNSENWLPARMFNDWSHISSAEARELYSRPLLRVLESQLRTGA